MTDKTVRLVKDHTHQNVKYKAGSDLTLSARVADWLVDASVAVHTNSVSRTSMPPPVRRGCCGWKR